MSRHWSLELRGLTSAKARKWMVRFLILGLLGLFLGSCSSWQAAQLYREGSLALEKGEFDLAVSDLEAAAALQPDSSEIQNHLGIAYEGSGEIEDARRAFERAVALDCDNASASTNLEALREAHWSRESSLP